MDRLGEPVHNVVVSEESIPSKRKVLSESPKKEKKKDKKKDKKKEKKKKKKSKSKKHKNSDSEMSEAEDLDDGVAEDANEPVFDADEEELLSFFETESKPKEKSKTKDVEAMIKKMKKQNDETLRRLKEITEDKLLHGWSILDRCSMFYSKF